MVRSTENRDDRSAKARILEVYEMDGNWKVLAENLSIPKTTLYRWISKGYQPDTRGGPRNCKVKQVHLDFIQALVDKNPRITLKVISERIEAQFGFKLSKSTVAKYLDMMTYTLKDVRFVPERANSIENKNKRSLFCSKLLNYQSTGKPILFMDETNFNLHISRRDGRSLKRSFCPYSGCQYSRSWMYWSPWLRVPWNSKRIFSKGKRTVLDARMFESCKETIWESSCDGC